MSKANFLKLEYRIEPIRKDKKCGIVDGVDEAPAYTTLDEKLRWNATIVNDKEFCYQFVPVDHNIIIFKANGNDKESTCDGMLLVEEKKMIAFVELKDVRVGGTGDAIDQLENTIKLFLASHHYDIFRFRRAYAANITHPLFQYNRKDDIERFRTKYKFALYPEATIKL